METSLPSFSFSRCVSLISLPPRTLLPPPSIGYARISHPPPPELSVALSRVPPPLRPAFRVPISLPLCATPRTPFSTSPLPLPVAPVSLRANARNDGRRLRLIMCWLLRRVGECTLRDHRRYSKSERFEFVVSFVACATACANEFHKIVCITTVKNIWPISIRISDMYASLSFRSRYLIDQHVPNNVETHVLRYLFYVTSYLFSR